MTCCSCGGAGTSGCCSGIQVVTPRAVVDRPGLPAIDYRPGTFADFLETMIARLASRPELTGYTTRDSADPGIALLDCWALAADIVAFYAERVANEGYLGTATQPDSLFHLASLVNYQPRPAIGASGYLAFTMDPGSAGPIPAGTQARSIAAPGQAPQTFETSEDIAARSDWNQLAPRMTMPGAIVMGDDYQQLTFTGTSLGVQPGTRLLFDFGSAGAESRVVTAATPDFTAGTTVVQLVPTAPTGTDAAWTDVSNAIDNATASSAVPPGQFAQAVVAILDSLGENQPDYDSLARFITQLTEAQTIGTGRVPANVASWLADAGGPVSAVVDAATALLGLLAAADRRLPPPVEYLRLLAQGLVAPFRDGEPDRSIPAATLDRAVPLVTAAAMLPALRVPPSSPPATAIALPQAAATTLDPSSSAITALLAAADPRLAGLVGTAVSRQAVTPPPSVSTVIALKTKASARPWADPLSSTDSAPAGVGTPVAGPGVAVLGAAAPPAFNVLSIDGTPDSLVSGSWLIAEEVVTDASGTTRTQSALLRVTRVDQGTRIAQVGTGASQTSVNIATSVVTLSGEAYDDNAAGRLTVYFGGAPVPLADTPVTDDIGGARVTLAQAYNGLHPGQRLIVTGERTDIPGTTGVVASEATMVGGVEQSVDPGLPGDSTLTVLVLAVPLAYTYQRDTATIYGNVAAATQGETRAEVLGGGDAGQAGQSFPLRQVSATSPLTWLPSDNALGAADTLTVRVNGVAWQESAGLTQAGPNDQAYQVATGSDGGVTVTFGDGVHGARLPTGQQNVTASYRIGGDNDGNVAAGRVTQLASRPLGVNAVTNPLPTTGGADGDGPDAVRTNAALRSLALDRLLSVQDYADFTAARAGIGKAAAIRVTDGDREVVHVTITGASDAPLDASDALVTSLRQALADLGDPFLPVQVDPREVLLLVLSAGVSIGAAYSWDLVEPVVRAAALAAASFAATDLGQPVYLSAMVAAMQAVPGVEYIDVDLFTAIPATANPVALATTLLALSGQSTQSSPSPVTQVVEARLARYEECQYTVGHDETGTQDTLTAIALREGTTVAALAALNPQLAQVTGEQITGVQLPTGTVLTISQGIRPAQLAILRPDVPQTLILRSIP